MENTTFKNGLTVEQVEAAKEKFKSVSLKQICKDHGLSYAIINNVLRDLSPRVEELHKALAVADKLIAYRQQLVREMPC